MVAKRKSRRKKSGGCGWRDGCLSVTRAYVLFLRRKSRRHLIDGQKNQQPAIIINLSQFLEEVLANGFEECPTMKVQPFVGRGQELLYFNSLGKFPGQIQNGRESHPETEIPARQPLVATKTANIASLFVGKSYI